METFDELALRINELIPDAVFGEDLEGQLIVYTGLRSGVDDRLVSVDG